jgi:hypothetical protein
MRSTYCRDFQRLSLVIVAANLTREGRGDFYSSETKHFRFFCAISELSDAEAHQLCEMDDGIRELYAVELSDNHKMHDFARELGMTTRHDSGDATQVIYSMPI